MYDAVFVSAYLAGSTSYRHPRALQRTGRIGGAKVVHQRRLGEQQSSHLQILTIEYKYLNLAEDLAVSTSELNRPTTYQLNENQHGHRDCDNQLCSAL